MTGVVIVGAGLGGLRAAESLRSHGFTGAITIVGDEPHLPYNRPPLSKEALKGGVDVSGLEFRRKAVVDDVTWRLGSPAVGCDLDAQTVTLSDGAAVHFDGLVIATGIRPRDLSIPGPRAGRFFLRDAADAAAFRERLTPGARLLILGAGFIGCEVAATARGLGCEVDVVTMDAAPMLRPLGAELGAAMRRRHEAHGVRFHTGRTVAEFLGETGVTGARLDDGTTLDCDVVLEAVGSVPNTEWLVGSGLDLADGVLVDDTMRASGTAVPVVAVGDVARYAHTLFDASPRRVEHWNLPTETGKRAGATLASLLAGEPVPTTAFTPMPSFWSDQYDHKLQSFGLPGLADEVVIASGEPDGSCVAEYRRGGTLVGVIGIDATSALVPYRAALMAG
ncbi:MAG: NAD(P)/FAD-dependent oxidoreductase [Actinomycetales bacterium]|nr:NAD(P)/FAD-dependent oxidoreductase [Actinomycetales bacterium]